MSADYITFPTASIHHKGEWGGTAPRLLVILSENAMTQSTHEHPVRRVKHLSPYFIPIGISLVGFLMLLTVFLWPIGIVLILAGFAWALVSKWITQARLNAERKGELPP
jgi:hypothetical protein